MAKKKSYDAVVLFGRSILIDGKNINDLDEKSIRGNITVISQNPYIFNMSIKDNLRLVKSNLSDSEIEKACKHNGMFALVSDYYKEADTALAFYRKREWIEDYFERFQQKADGNTSRTGNPENLNGRLFVQFIAMCYIEELHERIREMKSKLGISNGDSAHDTKDNLDKEKALKNWLKKRSMYRILKWFDAYETVEVSSEIQKRRWNSESIERDRLFLKLLGMEA